MSKEEISDLKEIKECLIGTEYDRKKGLCYKVDTLISSQNKTDDTLLVMQNQINQLQKRRTFIGGLKSIVLLFAK